MPKHHSPIMRLQDEYLKTKDPEKVGELYRVLVNLGLKINLRENLLEDEDGVMDLAADICMRLMETGSAVIQSAPSAYMRDSMFYRSKLRPADGRLVPLEDTDIPYDESDDAPSYDEYSGWLVERMEDGSEASKLAAQVIESRICWRDVRRAIEDKDFRSEFSKKMKEVKDAVEEDLQSAGVHETV